MWTPEEPISKLEKEIRKQYRNHAEILYKELSSNKLEVELIPAPDPQFIEHKIRIAVNHPPYWFSELYHKYKYGINRKRSLEALNRIQNYEDKKTENNKYIYDAMFRELIKEKSEKYKVLEKENSVKIEKEEKYEINYNTTNKDFDEEWTLNEFEGEIPF